MEDSKLMSDYKSDETHRRQSRQIANLTGHNFFRRCIAKQLEDFRLTKALDVYLSD
ncbi:hypothetical protein [Phocaeicola barnesiae]|uniref:hypothetical protein n=1 Tax=Phocaeicola barnesiae TaxID=376804 RepID=UPI0025A41D8B|nr:hypothetical protein [Phocaeicola barnesiae]